MPANAKLTANGRSSMTSSALALAHVLVDDGIGAAGDSWALNDRSACRLCCLGTCPGGAPWHARGAGIWKGHCTTRWLFVGSCEA